MFWLSRRAATLAAAVVGLSNLSSAHAASASWAAGANGSWNSAANWLPATVPNGAGDNATISIGGTYTVTLNSAQTVNTLAITSAGATFSQPNSGTLSAANINISAGTYSLNGGAISGATITPSGSGTFIPSNNGGNRLINNSSYVGDLNLTGGSLRFESGSTFTGPNAAISVSILGWQQTNTLNGKTITLTANSTFAVEGSNTLTLGSTTSVNGGLANMGRNFNVGGSSALVNNGTITGNSAGQTFVLNPNVLINTGILQAAVGNLSVDQVSGASFSNQGLLRASGGGVATIQRFSSSNWTNAAGGTLNVSDAASTIIVAGNWNNLGTFVLNGGTLTLEGTFTRAGIGTVNRTGGTLNIAGFLDNSGGTLTLNATTGDYRMLGGTISGGTISNAGGNLVFGPNGGNRLINNATVLGDLSVSSGQVRFETGATFTGGTANVSNGVIGWQQTSTIFGKTFNLTNSTTFAVEGTNTLTIGNTTTVNGASANMGRNFNVGGTPALINNGTIAGNTASQNLSLNAAIVVNSGTLLASPGNLSLDQTSGTFTNQGLMRAANGGLLAIERFVPATFTNAGGGTLQVADASSTAIVAGNWSNLGTFILNGGTLTLEGTFTRSGIGTINRTGGTLNISGFLDNAGGTLTLNATTGDYRMFAGTINGGTISNAGANLVFGPNGGNRLINNATLLGDVILNNGQVRFESGATFTGANATVNTNSILGWQQTNTLTGKNITITGSTMAVEGTNTLTLASSTIIRGASANVGQTFNVGGTSALVNNGTLLADTAGQNLNINPNILINTGTILANPGNLNMNAASFSNQGRMRALGGGVLAIQRFSNNSWTNAASGTIEVADAASIATLAGNWTNSGNVVLNAGTLNLEGTFTRGGVGAITRTGGTINITGFLDNAGGTLTLSASTGDYRLLAGTISDGTISSAGGNLVFGPNGNNRLINNATLLGNLVLSSGQVRFESGATFTGGSGTITASSILGWQQSSTLSGKTITLASSTFAVEGTSTLTLASNTTVRGSGDIGRNFNVSGTPALINNGTISASSAGQTLLVNPVTLQNTGTLEAVGGGRLNFAPAINLGGNPGRLRADGIGSVVQIPGGTYTVNQPAVTTNHGLIFFQGTYTKAATFDVGGRLVFDYTGASPFASIKAEVLSGYAAGAWNGPGLNSSAAAVAPSTGLGFAESSDVVGVLGGGFAGVSVDGTAVLVRYTLRGDNNLDGAVNLDDFTRLAAAFGTSANWSGGDSNYDGVVNLDDFTALAANFGLSLGADAPRAAVPEPSAGALVAVGSLLLRARRRR